MQKNHIPEPKRRKFIINDNLDILIEILKRLDGPSIGVAACVCRLWCTIARSESVWEQICFRNVTSPLPPSVRSVVAALGGYKRLYMVSIRPVLSRLGYLRRRVWTQDEVQLSLSLFCVDYYERLAGSGRRGGDAAAALSLTFLCNTTLIEFGARCWQTAGENPIKTPVPYIIIFGTSTPFVVLAIAFANGWVKVPVR